MGTWGIQANMNPEIIINKLKVIYDAGILMCYSYDTSTLQAFLKIYNCERYTAIFSAETLYWQPSRSILYDGTLRRAI